MILEKLPQDLRDRDQSQIVLSIKKKQLDDNKYLFETLYELFNMGEDEGGAEAGQQLRNQRMNSANLRRAGQVDKQLVQYSRSHSYHKVVNV